MHDYECFINDAEGNSYVVCYSNIEGEAFVDYVLSEDTEEEVDQFSGLWDKALDAAQAALDDLIYEKGAEYDWETDY